MTMNKAFKRSRILIIMLIVLFTMSLAAFCTYAADENAPAKVNLVKQDTGYEAALLSWKPVSSSQGTVYYEVRDAKKDKVVKYEVKKNAKKEHYETSNHTYAKATDLTTTSVRIPVEAAKNGKLPNSVKYKVYAYVKIDGKNAYSDPTKTKSITVIHPMYIEFKVKSGTKYYSNERAKKALGKLKAGKTYYAFGGDRVNGPNDSTLLMKMNGKTVYVKARDVTKTKQRYNSKKHYTDAEVTSFINDSGLNSKPKKVGNRPRRMIWVNTYNQRVYLFKGKKGKWKIEKNHLASTGAGKINTPFGFNRVTSKWDVKDATGTKWWCIFNGVGIHANLRAGGKDLGKPSSGGCVRILTQYAKWFYYNVSKMTTVYVY